MGTLDEARRIPWVRRNAGRLAVGISTMAAGAYYYLSPPEATPADRMRETIRQQQEDLVALTARINALRAGGRTINFDPDAWQRDLAEYRRTHPATSELDGLNQESYFRRRGLEAADRIISEGERADQITARQSLFQAGEAPIPIDRNSRFTTLYGARSQRLVLQPNPGQTIEGNTLIIRAANGTVTTVRGGTLQNGSLVFENVPRELVSNLRHGFLLRSGEQEATAPDRPEDFRLSTNQRRDVSTRIQATP